MQGTDEKQQKRLGQEVNQSLPELLSLKSIQALLPRPKETKSNKNPRRPVE